MKSCTETSGSTLTDWRYSSFSYIYTNLKKAKKC